MNVIAIHPPDRGAHEVLFRWSVSPPSGLYNKTQFTLRFPRSIDISKVPDYIWWHIALACLHCHWPLLRPCRVHLPIRLSAEETAVWERLLDAEIWTLEALAGSTRVERQIEIAQEGDLVIPGPPLPDSGRSATAFSGGKDSLVQAGILREIGPRPLLVTVTSCLPGLEDHLTPRRRAILDQVAHRGDVTLIEVHSDQRSTFDNAFADACGYPTSVNGMSDTFLYYGALLAVGAALDVPHLFLASEAEVQCNTEMDGRIIQHTHYMYSAVTQRTLQALVAQAGIRYCSLTSPLHSYQVQELLWTRYPDLSALQYSCWRVRGGDWVCNSCSQCLRIAFMILALGESPSEVGFDMVKLLNAMRDWSPKALEESSHPGLPSGIVSSGLHLQAARAISRTSLRDIVREIAINTPADLSAPQVSDAISAYRALRERAMRRIPPGPPPGYRPGFIKFIDPLVRGRVAQIYAEAYEAAPKESYREILERCDALTAWILEPLHGHQPQ
jgi:hypothetical protein